MSDLPPQDMRIEGYELDRLLGQGGFARVFAAHQPRFDRTVAIKVVDARVTDPAVRARFERECQAMGKLTGHPHIVTVYDSGFVSDRPWLAMEFLSGGSLADRLADDGPMSVERVLKIGISLAAALETAHRAGVLHRDVKPENVMVDGYGQPRLVDFGIARLEGGPSTTTTGRVTASIAHAPPEVFDNAVPHPSWDTYALGSTMFTLLTGRYAFTTHDSEMLAILKRILYDPVPDLRPEGIPDAVAGVIERAMAKGQQDRYASALAMGRELQRVQGSLGQPVGPLMVPDEPPHDDRPPPAGPTVDIASFQRPPPAVTPPGLSPAGTPYTPAFTPAFTPAPTDERAAPPQTPQPGPTPQPGWTPQPSNAPQPGWTPQPGHTPQPGWTPQPGHIPQPGWAPQPGHTPQPGRTGQPAQPGFWGTPGGKIAGVLAGIAVLSVIGVTALVIAQRGGDDDPSGRLEPGTAPETAVATSAPPPDEPAGSDALQPSEVLLREDGVIAEDGAPVDYTVDLPAGQSIRITVDTPDSSLDPTITVTDAQGSELGMDDDGGDGLDSMLVVTAPADGAYRLSVGSYQSTSSGAFRLTVTAL